MVAAEGIAQLLRLQEQGILQLRLYGRLRRELDSYLNKSGDYRKAEDVFPEFVDKVSKIRAEINEGLIDTLSKSTGPLKADEQR